jgi:hypothetical protein
MHSKQAASAAAGWWPGAAPYLATGALARVLHVVLPAWVCRLQDRQKLGAASSVDQYMLEDLEKGKAMYSLDCHKVGATAHRTALHGPADWQRWAAFPGRWQR